MSAARVYNPDPLEQRVAELMRASREDAEACENEGPVVYSIMGRAAGDPDEERRLATHHISCIRAAAYAYRLQTEELVSRRSALQRMLTETEAALEIARTDFESRTAHDRAMLAPWVAESEAFSGRKKSVDLHGCTVGARTKTLPARIEATDEALAGLFPDLTKTVLADREAARKRLAIQGETVVLAETGEVVEHPDISVRPEQRGEIRYIRLGDIELPLVAGEEVHEGE